MPRDFPGPHHCVATARAVCDSFSSHIKERCAAAGGRLSLLALEEATAEYLSGMVAKFDWFEKFNRDCMKASACFAPPIFGREMILSSVLATACCGEFDAAFGQRGTIGNPEWRQKFFDALAHFVRNHADDDIDSKMLAAYAEAAQRFGTKLTVIDVAAQPSVERVVQRFTRGLKLADADALTAAAATLVSFINSGSLAGDADLACAITQDEAIKFLTALRQRWN